MLYWCL